MSITPQEFININKEASKTSELSVQFGYIDPSYASGRPKIKPAGSDTVVPKQYPYLSSYTPIANDYVMIIKDVIIGKVI